MAHLLRNAWYVACLPQHIDDKPLGRTICREALVFYRAACAKAGWCVAGTA